jgi:two-component system, chemotaxis family, chemotaxis protein CheY
MGKQVLLIDDDDDVRDTLRDFLEDQGYVVAGAANGREALGLLSTLPERPCFVLLDLMMPVMDGWEFLRVVSSDADLAQLPVVISTSSPERAPPDHRVIPKPVNLREFLATVRAHCPGGP